MSVILYGISNCDTVKKARKWLDAGGIHYVFHDFRKDGIDDKLVKRFLDQLDADTLINKRGLSWRKLTEDQKQLGSKAAIVKLLVATPTLIKRPVLDASGELTVGFKEELYQQLTITND